MGCVDALGDRVLDLDPSDDALEHTVLL
jgi:hypothetical protein